MRELSNGNELPNYVFLEKFDSFMLFDFDSLMQYFYDGLFIENLKKRLHTEEIFVNIHTSENENNFLWNSLPLCEVRLNLNLPIDGDWYKSKQLNEQEKSALNYFMWTHPQYFIYDSTRNWMLYCVSNLEVCVLGMKSNVEQNFSFLKEQKELIKYKSVEDYYKLRYFVFKDEEIKWAITELKKNYPQIIV